MKKVGILLLTVLFCLGCQKKEESTVEYKKLMEENDYVIVDVRTKEEYEESHIKDAILLPYDEIDESTSLDKNKLIFVYCKSGVRSNQAYETLKSLGYNVYDLGAFEKIDLLKE